MCYLCLVFFFKQKTSYEMRISDWSSDVCSSDLVAGPFRLLHFLLLSISERDRPAERRAMHQPPLRQRVIADREVLGRDVVPHHQIADKIGRASCRERVCQYV